MIEIISNETNTGNSEQGYAPKLPKNVKQIGEIEGSIRIFLEDYVMTYIMNSAKKRNSESRVGILLGESKEHEGIRYNFISAGMEIDYKGEFDASLWSEIYEEKNKHFSGKEIIGWYLIEEEPSKNRMLEIERIHLNNFAGSEKCLFLLEAQELEGDFYIYENRSLKTLSGYNIYYEKNEQMQDYMISDNKGVSVDSAVSDRVTTSFREIINSKNESKNSNFGYAITGFLAVVIIVIGVNMINSYEKLENLDYMMNNISKKVTDMKAVPVVNLPGLVEPESKPSETQTQAPTENQTQAPTEKPTQAPTEKPTQAPTESIRTHTVKQGESIYAISRKYYGDDSKVSIILKMNEISNPDKIYPGQTIKLP